MSVDAESTFHPESSVPASQMWREMQQALRPIASLKLTVGLFACSMVLVLAGTLAQVEADIWDVIRQYFRCWFAKVPLSIFHHLFQPYLDLSEVKVGFWFPGGYLIGTLMAANLFAAHLSKFKLQASGLRLAAGSLVTLLGAGITWLVIESGHSREGLQSASTEWWNTVWTLMQGMTLLLAAVNVAGLYIAARDRSYQIVPLILSLALLGGAAWWMFIAADKRFDDSSMRILWQLLKAELAAVVLLAGCILLFRKRAGVVLLHAGIGLMMANEVVVDSLHVETQMMLSEGETRSHADDIREIELVFANSSDPKFDEEIVVRQPLIRRAADGADPESRTIRDPQLPFDVEIVEFLQNSRMLDLPAGQKSKATTGTGLKVSFEPANASTGTDSGGEVDQSAALIRLIDRETKKEVGTLLTGVVLQMMEDPELPPNRVTAGDRAWDVAMRFRRYHKRFQIQALDVRKEDYVGTTTPRDYRSVIRLVDPDTGADFEQSIWMNNPMRYSGDTFYQSGYFQDPRTGVETTTLSVVSNTGWMIPYISCMIVGTGMLAHFWLILVRFVQRRVTETRVFNWFGLGHILFDLLGGRRLSESLAPPANPLTKPQEKAPVPGSRNPIRAEVSVPSKTWMQSVVPWLLAATVGLWMLSKAREPSVKDGQFDFNAFGQIPVVYEGRVQPIDTLARNALLVLSTRTEWKDAEDKRQPAVRWLLDVLTNPEAAGEHKVYRVDHPKLIEKLGLERRKSHLYSAKELQNGVPKIINDVAAARKKDSKARTPDERKLLELARKMELVILLTETFNPPDIDMERLQQSLPQVMRQLQNLDQQTPPLIVPPSKGTGEEDLSSSDEWQTYARGWTRSYLAVHALGKEPGKEVHLLTKILVAYLHGSTDESADERKTQVADFNRQVAEYLSLVARSGTKDYDRERVNFEAWYNHFSPFYYAAFAYLFAFVFALTGLIDSTRTMNRAALLTIGVTLLMHTFALGARIYISGRPPVTNLYSSAVFIGFGCVVLGMIFESIYPLGIGNIVSSALGAGTLGVAYLLAGDGDTFKVLQAVLDTQFWLATHVVCITLGYSTTLLSGVLGVYYVLGGIMTSTLTADVRKIIHRMTYGTVCFGILFSFVGTVLGGLWADDSWGRFWGWDPKENGALLIVIWNALLLHARWDRMVNERGFAVLAVIGNMVTTWSWFGVNELGAGLHSYGFTEGVWSALWAFWISQVVIVGVGLIPTRYWISYRDEASGTTAAA